MNVGQEDGNALSSRVGFAESVTVGASLLRIVGDSDAITLGKSLGYTDGVKEGQSLDVTLGSADGTVDGLDDGLKGSRLGIIDGTSVEIVFMNKMRKMLDELE